MPRKSRATALRVCEPLVAVLVFQEIVYGALKSAAPRSAPSSWNCTLETVRNPTILTLALTGTVPETVDPDAGEVILTIKLLSWANAWGEKTRLDITSKAAPTRLPIFSMG